MKSFLTCLLMFMAAVAVAQTKINVTLDHADAMYNCNEQAIFTVTVLNGDQLHKEGKASIRLSNDGLTTISTKEVDLAAENPFTVMGTMEKPGILSLDVDVAAQPKRLHKVYGAAFEPLKIQPGAPEPEDFLNFWFEEFKKYRYLLESEPELTPLPRLTNDKVEGFKVAFAAPAGKIYGFLTVPKASGKYPAIVSVPGAGPSATEAPRLEDFVYLVMNVHTYDPDIPGKTSKESYNELNKDGMYMYKNIPDREKTYFHHGIIGIYSAVVWLSLQEKVARGCIGYHGSSQGGALGFILGANPVISAYVCNVPAMCDHLGYKQGRLAGWPQFCRQMKNSPEIEAMAQYYDAMNFAAHFRKDVPVRVIVGLADRTCSPSSVYAAYNRIPSSDKQIINEIGMGHEVWPSYHKQIAWMKGYLKNRMKELQAEEQRNKPKQDQINCVSRLKQMCLAMVMFTMDNQDVMPVTDGWRKAVLPYTGAETEDFFICPATGKPYQYIRQAIALSKIKEPSRVILFYEDFGNHDGKVAIAFVDGHVMSYSVDGCETIEELSEHHKLLLKAMEK